MDTNEDRAKPFEYDPTEVTKMAQTGLFPTPIPAFEPYTLNLDAAEVKKAQKDVQSGDFVILGGSPTGGHPDRIGVYFVTGVTKYEVRVNSFGSSDLAYVNRTDVLARTPARTMLRHGNDPEQMLTYLRSSLTD